MVIEHQRGLV